jgi:hypothetical protein
LHFFKQISLLFRQFFNQSIDPVVHLVYLRGVNYQPLAGAASITCLVFSPHMPSSFSPALPYLLASFWNASIAK